ncbi:MAG: ribokinase [Dysgonamonadaceae bacterium]|jgi:ribokinase|nr:ribokinase [Dysgonamonadaceae bacterium]
MMEKKRILVIGSTNTDMVIKAPHLPCPGETVLGGTFLMNAGGKGANQAVAAARLGASVTFVCKTGNDIFGQQSKQLFADEGIDTTYVFIDAEHPSGIALITVDAKAENCIVVASGANACLLPSDLANAADAIEQSDMVLMQLEIPLETIEYVANIAHAKGKTVILNPAPAQPLSKRLLQNVSILTPNETEASMISGVPVTDAASACEAARAICAMGVQTVIITLGAKGALIYANDFTAEVLAEKVEAVDTTAAGDVFNGALAVALSENREITDAVQFACKAASISVTRIGAQSSAPYRKELNDFEPNCNS